MADGLIPASSGSFFLRPDAMQPSPMGSVAGWSADEFLSYCRSADEFLSYC